MSQRYQARDLSTLVYEWAHQVIEGTGPTGPLLFKMEFLLGSEIEAEGGRQIIQDIEERRKAAEISQTQANWLKLGVGIECAKKRRILKRRLLQPDPNADETLSADPIDEDPLHA